MTKSLISKSVILGGEGDLDGEGVGGTGDGVGVCLRTKTFCGFLIFLSIGGNPASILRTRSLLSGYGNKQIRHQSTHSAGAALSKAANSETRKQSCRKWEILVIPSFIPY